MTAARENHKGEILAVLESVSHFVQNSIQKFLLPLPLYQKRMDKS